MYQKIEILSIDDLVNKNKSDRADFIKMDIAGTEVPALNGAINTIKEFKPKLAISVYHKADNLYEIPELVYLVRKDYIIISDEVMLHAI